MYHPDCKACKEFAFDYENLASYIKQKGIPIEVNAINYSKSDDLSLNVSAYPTFRLYYEVGKFVTFDENDLTLDNMKKWILKNELKL